MSAAQRQSTEGQGQESSADPSLKPWTAPLLSLVVVDVAETKGASGHGGDGGAVNYNAS